MKLRIGALLLFFIVVLCCVPNKESSDREAIEKIASDLESGIMNGDLTKIANHLSSQAKQNGYEANRFLIECSYDDTSTIFMARNIKVMADSAHLSFVIMPSDQVYADSLQRSLIRLRKSRKWKIESYNLVRN